MEHFLHQNPDVCPTGKKGTTLHQGVKAASPLSLHWPGSLLRGFPVTLVELKVYFEFHVWAASQVNSEATVNMWSSPHERHPHPCSPWEWDLKKTLQLRWITAPLWIIQSLAGFLYHSQPPVFQGDLSQRDGQPTQQPGETLSSTCTLHFEIGCYIDATRPSSPGARVNTRVSYPSMDPRAYTEAARLIRRNTGSSGLLPRSWPRTCKTPRISKLVKKIKLSFLMHNRPLPVPPEFMLMRWFGKPWSLGAGCPGNQRVIGGSAPPPPLGRDEGPGRLTLPSNGPVFHRSCLCDESSFSKTKGRGLGSPEWFSFVEVQRCVLGCMEHKERAAGPLISSIRLFLGYILGIDHLLSSK